MNEKSEHEPSHPQSKLDHLIVELVSMAKSIQENTRATSAMSLAIRQIYLVPLALAAMGLAAWLLYVGKISEINFMLLACACLSPFFGEGIGRIVERLPLVGRKAEDIQKTGLVIFLVAVALLLLV